MASWKIRFSIFLVLFIPCALFASDFDCIGSACPSIKIVGDSVSTLPSGEVSPFSGLADPSIRRDPVSGDLWMAYSWPNIRVAGKSEKRRLFRRNRSGMPGVDIHLARSQDAGRNWRFYGKLWSAMSATSSDGESGHMGHEVANLLPVNTPEGTLWYGARLQYFLPDEGGFRDRPVSSFRILVGAARTPAGLSDGPVARLGSMKTDDRWGMDVNLASLSPQTRHCMLWNEPALYHDGNELYLALSCMAFRGKSPDMGKNDLVVFATNASGTPSQWRWRFAGKLAGVSEAKELGGERLTQVELAKGRDGKLLAVVTPDTWESGDFIHHGCRVVEVDTTGGTLKLARDGSGHLKVRATILASDAGSAGTAACSYDPSSETGVIITKRIKEGGAVSHARLLRATLHRTGIHP